MSDASALIVAVTSLLAIFGPAVAFVWRRIDKRISAAEATVAECESHRDTDKVLIGRLTFEVMRDAQAVRLLFDDLHKRDPKSATLKQVGQLLRQRWDPGLVVPDDWNDLLTRLDENEERRKVA